MHTSKLFKQMSCEFRFEKRNKVMFLSFCWQRFPVWRSRVAESSVPHDKEIGGGRRSEDAKDSGNMKEVREI